VLAGEEAAAARAEAARRLLAAPKATAERVGPSWLILGAAAVSGLTALGLYLALGSPATPDQPFKSRLAQWRTTPPTQLRPDEMVALLRDAAKTRPDDPRVFTLLGRVERANGDVASAVQDLKHAAALQPNDADLQAVLAEALVSAAGSKVTPEAMAALDRALAIDPKNPQARYYLGMAKASMGQGAEAAKIWRGLAGDLEPTDRRRGPLLVMADRAEKGPIAKPSQSGAAPEVGSGEQAAFIRGMVASLKARLDANPDDPAGWARLVRSYRVLGDPGAEQAALARARQLFATRPGALAPIEAEAK